MSKEDWRIGKRNNETNAWKGDKAGYVAIHTWLSKNYTKPDMCEQCKTTEFTRLEWANISGEYKRERSDYKVLCVPCHRILDLRKDICKHGHGYVITKSGRRECRTCKNETQRKYMERKNGKIVKV